MVSENGKGNAKEGAVGSSYHVFTSGVHLPREHVLQWYGWLYQLPLPAAALGQLIRCDKDIAVD